MGLRSSHGLNPFLFHKLNPVNLTSMKRSLIIFGVLLLAFGGLPTANATKSLQSTPATVTTFPGDRPFDLKVPAAYSPDRASPLIISLHGYTSSGAGQENYFKLGAVASARDILYVAPDGSLDTAGNRFWNATPACCNFYGSGIDDEAYIMSIIDSVSKSYNVDQSRIYVVGHSNGGFMTHHMACTHADRIAAIVSFSGATFKDQSSCKPTSPISVLQIWGTADETIYYRGGMLVNPYPGAGETISDWAKLDSCSAKAKALKGKIDIDRTILGSETTVSLYSGCAGKSTVELWSIAGGAHVPKLRADFASKIVDFLLAHPKK